MNCDLCGKAMASFTHIVREGKILITHPSCAAKVEKEEIYAEDSSGNLADLHPRHPDNR